MKIVQVYARPRWRKRDPIGMATFRVVDDSSGRRVQMLRQVRCHDCGHRHLPRQFGGEPCSQAIRRGCSDCVDTWPSVEEVEAVEGG